MTCFNTELKRVMQSRKRAEAEARRLMKTEDEPGEFEYKVKMYSRLRVYIK